MAINGCGTVDDGTNTDYIDDGTSTNYGVSTYDMRGRSITGNGGDSYIAFCSNGSAYSYDNYNGYHYGSYTLNAYKIDFYDDAGGSYALTTNDGYFDVGYTYPMVGVENITIDSIDYSGC
jgi:hypothetical protein